MTEGITCYERDEELCSDQICIRNNDCEETSRFILRFLKST